MDWDGNDGLRKMWDQYYRCTNPAYIQSLQATRNTLTIASRKATNAPHDKVPNDGLVRGDANATTTTCNSSLPSGNQSADISHTKDIIMLPPQHGCQVDLQVVLDKHHDDILCLLGTKSPSNQGTIPQRMLSKIRKVNMGTMVKINDSFAQAGGKALTMMKLKELCSKA